MLASFIPTQYAKNDEYFSCRMKKRYSGSFAELLEKQNRKFIGLGMLSVFAILLFLVLIITFPIQNAPFRRSSPLGVVKPPKFVQSATADTGVATRITAAWNKPTKQGSFLLAVLSVRSTDASIRQAPAGWIKITEKQNDDDLTQWIYYYPNAPSQKEAMSFLVSDPVNATLLVTEYEDVESLQPYEKQQSAIGLSSVVTNTLNQPANDSFVITAVSAGTTTGFSPPTTGNLAAQYEADSEDGVSSAVMHVFTPDATEVKSSTTLETTTPWISTSLAFRAAHTTVVSADAATTTVTLSPVADAYVDATTPAVNQGSNGWLIIDYVSATSSVVSYLKFDLSSLAGRTITDARLRLHTQTDLSSGSVGPQIVKLVNNTSWNEATITWDTRPSVSSIQLGSFSNTMVNTSFDVSLSTSDLQGKIGGLMSMAIDSTSTDGSFLMSSEATIGPQLIITSQDAVTPTAVPPTATPTPAGSSTFSGQVYIDADRSGSKNTGEVGYQGATVTLSNGQSKVTDASGDYTFTSLPDGNYTVSLVVPSGYEATNITTKTSTLPPSDTKNFAIAPLPTNTPTPTRAPTATPTSGATSTFTGQVYIDADRNGAKGSGEAGYVGATVNLSNGATRVTDANGDYSFTNLAAGTYTVSLVVPSGYEAINATTKTSTLPPSDTKNFAIAPLPTATPTRTPTPVPPTATPTSTPSTFSGQVYIDTDRSGSKGTSEVGYAGATITLSNGTTRITDNNGNYSFTNIAAGSYTVSLTVPSGYEATNTTTKTSTLPPSDTKNFAIAPLPTATPIPATATPTRTPTPIPTVTPTSVPLSTFSGQVYIDTNRSGSKNTGEVGYQGATVTLSSGATTTTDASGNYVFASLAGGAYTVTLVMPAGYEGVNATTKTSTLPPSDTKNFAIAALPRYTLSGALFVDTNSNGAQDTGESAYAGNAAVALSGDGTANTTSNGSGVYTFSNLLAGTYTVAVTVPAGFTATTTNPVATTVTTDTTVHFGLRPIPTSTPVPTSIPTFTMAGNVYIDANSNGVKDSGEVNYTNASVSLSGSAVRNTTTNTSGNYTFSNLTSGTYTTTLTVPAGYIATTVNPVSASVATDTTVNFGISPVPTASPTIIPTITPTTVPPTATPLPPTSTPVPTAIPSYTISGSVYVDSDRNGVKDTGENGYEGAEIILSDAAVLVTTTNIAGEYTMADLIAGSYTVTVTIPSGYDVTTFNPVEVTVTADTTINFGIAPVPTATPTAIPPTPTTVPAGCDFTIGSSITTADGRSNYSQVAAGDTVCILSGTRSELTIQNFTGTSGSPIRFINNGGQVVISQLTVNNSSYIQVTGSGDAGVEYGIKVNGPTGQSANLRLLEKTDNFEVDHIEITGGNIGANVKTKASCGSPTYDYTGDGVINSSDEVTATNYKTQNIRLHNMYVHDVANEAYYLGNNFTEDTNACPEIRLENVEVDHNQIADFGVDGINLKGARTGTNTIHHNTILRGSTDLVNRPGQDGSISVTQDSKADVTYNWTEENQGPGIRHYGHGPSLIANNVVVRNGDYYATTDNRGSGIRITSSSTINNTFSVLNNTVVNSKAYGIYLANGRTGTVKNNIVAGSGNVTPIQAASSVTVTNNHVGTVASAGFVDAAADDYHLTADSLAVDAGVDLTSSGVTDDYESATRSQGITYDQGAFESSYAAPTNTPVPTAIPTYTVSGSVYVDTNQNGVKETGENGYAAATVTLTTSSAQTVTTSASGDYTFAAIASGVFSVEVTIPDGYQGTTTNPATITVSDDTTINFGIAPVPTSTPLPTDVPTATPVPPTETPTPTEVPPSSTPVPTNMPSYTINGVVYMDSDGNGVKDLGEEGFADAQIVLSDAGTVIVATDLLGDFTITDLVEGVYTVTLTVPEGYQETTLNPVIVSVSADTTVNFGLAPIPTSTLAPTPTDREPTETPVPTLSVEPSETPVPFPTDIPPTSTPVPTAIPAYVLTGSVFIDTNQNGVQDGEEEGYSNGTVSVESLEIQTTTTDSSGFYTFSTVQEGTYNVIFSVPAGYFETTLNPVSITMTADTAVNFGIAPAPTAIPEPTAEPSPTQEPTAAPTDVPPTNTPLTPTEAPTEAPTPTPTTIPTYRLSGTVYVDANVNGVQDAEEIGYTGVAVGISGFGTTQSSDTGIYQFTDLIENVYTAAITTPSGYMITTSAEVVVSLAADTTVNFGIAPNPTSTPIPTVQATAVPTSTPTPTVIPSATPTASPTILPTQTLGTQKVSDINDDGFVNIFDMSYLLRTWGTNDKIADINGDTKVDIFDMSILLAEWDKQ